MSNLRTLSIADVAERTGLKLSTLYRLVNTGRLPALRPLGPRGRIRIRESALESWLTAQETAATPAAIPVRPMRDPDDELGLTDRAFL